MRGRRGTKTRGGGDRDSRAWPKLNFHSAFPKGRPKGKKKGKGKEKQMGKRRNRKREKGKGGRGKMGKPIKESLF
jgi:hypothetical protein